MIVGAAVCPGAPLLVPGLAPALAGTVPELIGSCRAAVASLRGVDRILLLTCGPGPRDRGVGTADRSIIHTGGTLISAALLSDSRAKSQFSGVLGASGASGPRIGGEGGGDAYPDDSGWNEPSPSPQAPGVGVVVGAALLDAAGIDVPAVAVEVGPDDRAEVMVIRAVTSPAHVGLLLIADGSAGRGPDSPSGGHPMAESFDATLAAALAAGDPEALSAAVAASGTQAEELMFTSGPAFRAFAEPMRRRPPQHADVLFDAAPFGVGYLVATWRWDQPS